MISGLLSGGKLRVPFPPPPIAFFWPTYRIQFISIRAVLKLLYFILVIIVIEINTHDIINEISTKDGWFNFHLEQVI